MLLIHECLYLSYSQYSMLAYLKYQIVYFYTEFTMNLAESVFLAIILAYLFI